MNRAAVTDIRRLDGVFVDSEDARKIVRALRLFHGMLPKVGSRPTEEFEELLARLGTAVHASIPAVHASESTDGAHSLQSFDHEFVDTITAARVLGCTPGNVRDRARRGTLPAVQVGGRWLVSTAGLHGRR